MNIIPGFLSGTGYFSDWSPTDLEAFSTHFQEMTLDEGAILFSEGDEDTAWYIIMAGRMSIVRGGADGASHILAELEKGEAFGEMSLLEKRPRMGSAMAMEKSVILKLDRVIFDVLIGEQHPIAVGMLREMAISQSRRLREIMFILQDLTEADMVHDVLPDVGPLDVNAVLRAGLLFN
jgi:CRP-like cAMP-binding protein